MAREVFTEKLPKKTMFVSRLGRLHHYFVCTFLCFFLMPGYLNSSLMLSGEAIDSKTLLASTRCRARCLNKLEIYLARYEYVRIKPKPTVGHYLESSRVHSRKPSFSPKRQHEKKDHVYLAKPLGLKWRSGKVGG